MKICQPVYPSMAATTDSRLDVNRRSIIIKENYFGGTWKQEYESLIEIQAGWIRGPDWLLMARLSALTTDMAFTQPVLYEFGDLKMHVLLIIGQRDRTALGKSWALAGVKDRMGNYQELGSKTKAAILSVVL